MRLKDVAELNVRSLDDSTSGDYVFKYIDISSVSFENGITLGEDLAFQNAPSRARRIVQKGDVLVSTVRTYLRAIADIDWDAENIIASTGFAVFTPNKNINPRFLAYTVKSSEVINQICSISKGVSYPAIQATILSSVRIPFYALSEQYVIATYLDKECDKITKEIDLLERKVDCYSRLLRSLIIETVTSKKLGIKYREYRLKDIFELRNGYTPSKGVTEYWEGGTIPWFRMEDIRKKGRILSDSIQHITQEAIKTAGLFEANSFILSTTATIGEHALIIVDSLANQRFTNFKIRKSLRNMIDIKWMFYKFFNIDEYCKMGCKVTTFASVDMVELSNMVIFLPPIDEQLKMASYLDEKCSKIDAIIEKIKLKIERLKELKRSLINEVITGQRTIKTSDL
jgi:type I restriction enzyme S subunit